MSLLESVRQSLIAVGRALRLPGFYLLLLLSLLMWSLAYQYKTSYVIDVGGLTDDAYLFEFHSKERNPELSYRWSRSVSTLLLPGIGNQPMMISITTIGFRHEGDSPMLSLEARGQTFPVATSGEPRTDTIFVERGNPWDADLRLVLSSPIFSPPGDVRELGVIVDRVVVEPADYGLRPLVIPPAGALGASLLTVGALYLAASITIRRLSLVWMLAAGLSLVVAMLILFARPELGLLVGNLPSLCGWALLLAIVGRTALDMLVGDRGAGVKFVVGAGSAAFVLAFLLRFGGLTYPQFLTSDIGLHIHNLQDVSGGTWLFTEPLPDGTPQPYPPALYAILSPLTTLFGSSYEVIGLLLKWSASLLDAAVCLWLAWAGSRLWTGRAGGLAALAYAVSPSPFELFSAGNYTNLFAQGVLHITLLSALVFLADEERHGTAMWGMLLSLGFALTMLGHYGMMLAALFTIFLFGLGIVGLILRGTQPSRSLALISACGAAFVGAFALYYWHFAGEIANQMGGVFGRLVGGRSTTVTPQVATEQPAREAFFQKLTRLTHTLVGIITVLMGLFGMLVAGRLSRPTQVLLAAWLAASAIFLALDQALGDAIRWYYFAAGALTLLAGRFLGLLMSRGRTARLLAWLSLAIMLLHVLYIWVGELIFKRYHA
jgi:hypothetical protein